MKNEMEDLSVSLPAGCEPPPDEPGRAGVRASELRHGKGQSRGQEPAWLKWSVMGMLGLLLAPVVIAILGWMGVLMLLGLAVVGLLAGIFVRLGQKH